MKSKTPFLVVALVVAAFLIFRASLLNYGEVFQVSEGREGVVVYEMLRDQEFILPLRNGELVPSKPPLFHWIGVLGIEHLGLEGEYALRFPSALSALFLLLGVLVVFSRIRNLEFALLSTGMLASSYCFLRLSADGRVDMLYSMFSVMALLLWLNALFRDLSNGSRVAFRVAVMAIRPADYIIIGLLCGFAVLAKGPLGLALPAMTIGAIAFFNGGVRAFCSTVFRSGWLLALLIPLPWYLLAAGEGQESFVSRQVVFENVTRFLGGGGITPKPFWYYAEHFWSQAAPWSLLLPLMLYIVIVGDKEAGRWSRLLPEDGKGRRFAYCLLCWFLVMVLFFSLSVGKRRAYLLPTLPALVGFLALVVSRWWEGVSRSESRLLKVRTSCRFLFTIVVTLFLFVAGLVTMVNAFDMFDYQKAAEVIAMVSQVVSENWMLLLPLCLGLGLGSFFCFWGPRSSSGKILFLGLLFLTEFVYVAGVQTGLTVKGLTHGYKQFASEVSKLVPENERLVFIKKKKDESFDGFFYYIDRRVLLAPHEAFPQRKGYYLARERWLRKHRAEATKGGQLREITSGGRLTDEPGEEIVLFEWMPLNPNIS